MIVWLLIPFSAPFALAQEQENLLARFYSEAPGAWRNYLAFSDVARQELLVTTVRFFDGTSEHHASGVVQTRAGRLIIRYLDSRLAPTSIVGLNDAYLFNIERRDAATGWSLIMVARTDLSQESTFYDRWRNHSAIRIPLRIDRETLDEMVSRSEFEVTHISIDEEGLWRIVFKYPNRQRTSGDRVFNSAQEGEIWLDPDKSWLVKRALLTCHSNPGDQFDVFQEEVVIEYEHMHRTGIPLRFNVRRTRSSAEASGFNYSFESVAEIELNPRLSDNIMRLSYYGLPEPEWYRPPRPWWLYSGIAAIVLCIIGAVVLRYWRRQ